MADSQSMVFPFANRGLLQKVKPSLLQLGQHSVLRNVFSEQEGAIQIRPGNKRLSASVGSEVHTMATFNLGGGVKKRYVGEGADIKRGSDFTAMPDTVATAVGTAGAVRRWEHVEYDGGGTSTPWFYVASPKKMVKDNGSLATMHTWGVKPPTHPAEVAVGGQELVVVNDFDNPATITASGGVKSGNVRINTTVTSVDGTGYVKVGVGTLSEFMVGTLVKVGSTHVVVDKIETEGGNFFYAYFGAVVPAPAQAVVDSDVTLIMAAAGQFTLSGTPAASDLGFAGVSSDGYETEDEIHFALYVNDATKISDLRIQFDVSTTPGTYRDYYDKAVIASQATSSLSGTLSPEEVAAERQQIADDQGLDLYDPTVDLLLEDVLAGLRPIELSPQSPFTSGQWTEITVPKKGFLRVGRAGSPTNNWAAVGQFRLLINATDAVGVAIANLYGIGGKNPTAGLTPYDYLYTYYDPQTGTESNPSVPMIDSVKISPAHSAVKITFLGTFDTKIPSTSSQLSVKIYRRGGTLPDDYRLVGSATNPGGGTFGTFVDNASDRDIVGAQLLEFDNDPPITSKLPIPLVARISSLAAEGGGGGGGAGGVTRITLTGLPTGFGNVDDSVTVGSYVTIGTGDTREVAYVKTVGTTWIECYTQYTHQAYSADPGETVECNAASGMPCDLVAQIGDTLFLAGDPNNPHILYMSKPGRPDSWPVVDLATGISHQIPVGSPSNPIHAVVEFNELIICLNKKSIFVIRVWNGQMGTPNEIPVPSGLIEKHAWCKAMHSIWYLGTDGIYELKSYNPVKQTESIDFIFKGKTKDAVAPLDYTKADDVSFAFRNHELIVQYIDTGGNYRTLRCEVLYGYRWRIEQPGDALTGTVALTSVFVERDSNDLYLAKSITSGGTNAYLYQGDVGTSEGWTTLEDDGADINFEFRGAAYDFGDAFTDKKFTDLMLEIENLGSSSHDVTVEIWYDHDTGPDPIDQFTVSVAPGYARYSNMRLGATKGKEAFAATINIKGDVDETIVFHSAAFSFIPLGKIQRGRPYDWDDLEWPHDKHLYSVTLFYYTNGQDVVVAMDTIEGLNASLTEAKQTFTVNSAVDVPGQKTFAIDDLTIVKKIKLRPTTTLAEFRLVGYQFERQNYPPDFVLFSEWDDDGTNHEKYVQQLSLDVDTGGVEASVKVQADSGDIQTVAVNTTTEGDRRRNITLSETLKGRKFRILAIPGVGGKFQLFGKPLFHFLAADKGPVRHTHAWDGLGWPFDKEIRSITIEYENSGGTIQVNVETLVGVDGDTIGSTHTFTLSGSGYALQTFTFPKDTVVKMIRVQPVSTTVTFHMWGYKVDQTNFPPDIVEATPETDLGWPCPKLLRAVILKIDTGGVAAQLIVEGDGQTVHTETGVTASRTGAPVILSPAPDQIASKFRVVPTPGANGKAQIFDVDYQVVREPCPLTKWDSYEQVFGYAGYKFMKQVWIEYTCAGTITLTIDRDGEELLHTVTLPVHASRETYRFFVPRDRYDSGLGRNVLNKSIGYRFYLEADDTSKPFKFYRDGSRVETMTLSGDQHAAFNQHLLWQNMEIPV